MIQDGLNALIISSSNGHGGVVEFLIKNKANIEAASKVRVRGIVVWEVVVGVENDDWRLQMMFV